MRVRVKLFAVASQLAGTEVIEVQLPEQATVAVLRQQIASQVPELAPLLPHFLIALDAEYAADTRRIEAGDEIACIPPVSGG